MRLDDMVIGDVLALGAYLGVRNTVQWFSSGRYRKRLAGPDGNLVRFLTVAELASLVGVRPAAVQWWIASNRLHRGNGLVPCGRYVFIDMKKFRRDAMDEYPSHYP
jgi:hypothetical protein